MPDIVPAPNTVAAQGTPGPRPDIYMNSLHGVLAAVQESIALGLADVNERHTDLGATPLAAASFGGHCAIVAELLAAGADVDQATKYGDTPLYSAAQKGNADVVQALVGAGADVNRGNICGFTPLFIAAQKGDTKTMAVLQSAGADVDKGNINGATPLFTASGAGQREAVEFLLSCGADVNKATVDGATPLSMVSQEGHTELARLLIKAGADVNSCDKYGAAPLMYSSAFGNHSLVEALLDAGADWTLSESDGYNAADSARENGNMDIALFIERWSELSILSRMTMLMIAGRGGTLMRASSPEASTAAMGDFACLPVEILHKIAMMVYIPTPLWRSTLPTIDWRSHAIQGRANSVLLRGEIAAVSRKADRLEEVLRENNALKAEIARLLAEMDQRSSTRLAHDCHSRVSAQERRSRSRSAVRHLQN